MSGVVEMYRGTLEMVDRRTVAVKRLMQTATRHHRSVVQRFLAVQDRSDNPSGGECIDCVHVRSRHLRLPCN